MVEAINFVTPSEYERKRAMGALGGTPFRVKKMIEGAETYWKPKVAPEANDWLASQFESGQSYDEFTVNKNAIVEEGKRDTICIQSLDKTLSKKFVADLKLMCSAYFCVKVKVLSTTDVEEFDDGRMEKRENEGRVQFNGSKILAALFRRVYAAEKHAVCVMAITNQDIYTEDFDWLFGVANVMTQCGVFSFCRYQPDFNGDQVADEADRYNLVLFRACKVMLHEIGHMFGIRHCIYYECLMNGCNHILESQTRPLHCCAVCLRKLQRACGFDPVLRYQAIVDCLAKFGGRFDLEN